MDAGILVEGVGVAVGGKERVVDEFCVVIGGIWDSELLEEGEGWI